MATIVITGAAGFLGQCLTAHLAGMGAHVIPVSRRRLPGLYQVQDYRQAPSGDVLIHLAEEPDRGKVNGLGENYVEQASELVGTLAARPHQKLIYASSGVVYGDEGESAYGVDAPVRATDTYSRSKLVNERIVLDEKGVVVRLSNLFGKGMSASNVMSDIIRQVPGSGALVIRDDKPVRDYLHVSDAASALGLLAESDYSGVVNVGSGIGTSVRALAELALKAAGQEERDIMATAPSSKHSINILDISATKRIIGWQPRARLEEQLARLIHDKARFS